MEEFKVNTEIMPTPAEHTPTADTQPISRISGLSWDCLSLSNANMSQYTPNMCRESKFLRT